MKYFTSYSSHDSFRVRLEGPEDEQNCFAVLAENLLGGSLRNEHRNMKARSEDSFAGKVIRFSSNKEFKKLLLWRSIFSQCAPNKQFDFMEFARKAVCEVRAVLKKDVVEICS